MGSRGRRNVVARKKIGGKPSGLPPIFFSLGCFCSGSQPQFLLDRAHRLKGFLD